MPYRERPPVAHPCPRCGVPLESRQIAEAPLAECRACGGVFVASGALDTLIGAEHRAEARVAIPGGATSLHQGGPMYVPCPTCGELMQRRQFALGANTVVDFCQAHGTWFDGNELGNVLAFVEGGGLDRARKKEDERRAAEERAARAPKVRLPFETPGHAAQWGRNDGWSMLARLFRSLRR